MILLTKIRMYLGWILFDFFPTLSLKYPTCVFDFEIIDILIKFLKTVCFAKISLKVQ